ncbi:efflux transporter periplasmic adaptor subunit, partial [Burkholderia pseudomallei]
MKYEWARTRRLSAALAVAAFVAAGCGKHESEHDAAAPREASVVTVKKTSVPLSVELPGRLDAYRQAEVRARVAGIVTARTYEEGQEVKRGAVLFRIDPAPFKAARDAAAGALEKAQAAHLAALDKRRRYDELVRD